ncbi:FecR family protein [Marinibaculum pumilum]|uniref:FecR family protein n=1 Tax=Marinibaculum pumilum TaxID=1766165 RepID=A0ABV7L4W7_9PROT
MNPPTGAEPGNNDAPVPDAMLETAAAWLARRREPPANPREAAAREAAFADWLDADPRHADAYAQASELWAALEVPAGRVLAEQPPLPALPDLASRLPPPRHRGRRGRAPQLTALAACLALVVAGILFWRVGGLDRLASDHATAVGELASISLADGSRIDLNTDTAIAVDLAGAQRQVTLLRGQAMFDVAPDPARPFVVGTPQGEIRVTGTRFDVRLADDGAVVSLLHGRVALSGSGASAAAAMQLSSGQQAEIGPDGPGPARPFDGAQVTAWLRGQFVFYDAPLARVVGELNRYRTGRILILDEGLEDLRVSGVFRIDRPEEALRVIAETLPVEVTRLTDLLVVLR